MRRVLGKAVFYHHHFFSFLMDSADELERRGLGVKVKGTWMGACFFTDDIVLMAESGKELQCMLDVVYKYANTEWKLRFNASKCGVLVVGQKKSGKLIVGFRQRGNKGGS